MSSHLIIEQLQALHEEHQDEMPGGAAKILSGLINSPIVEVTEHSIDFQKAEVLKHSGGVNLSDESKRKRVLQLNTFFKQKSIEFKITSRKNHYSVKFKDTLAEQLYNKAFEEYALEIADETDPDNYQPPEVAVGKLLFVSHNWRDNTTIGISREFLAELEQQLADRATEDLSIEVFCDLSPNKNFLLHREFQPQQDELCLQAQLCLILWNPGYEKSTACTQELSFFVDQNGNNLPNKAAIAMLERGRNQDIKTSKTEKISKRILFNYPHGSDHSLIHFWPGAAPGDRYDYVASLVDHIEACFKGPEPNGNKRTKEQKIRDELIDATDLNVKQGHELDNCDETRFVTPEGYEGSGFNRERESNDSTNSNDSANSHDSPNGDIAADNRIDIVPYLAAWTTNNVSQQVQRVTVLLGDFGFGKTITCRLLAEHLSQQYKQNQQSGVLPIYLDLKALLGELEHNLNQPVEHLLETMLARTGGSAFKGTDIIKYIKTQKCLVIFDGFDEIGHKLLPEQQQAMYHKLLNIIPQKVFKNDLKEQNHKKWDVTLARFPSKILVSCRTHFFNHIGHETKFLSGSERHAISETNIRRFYMAPFRPEAIKNYLIDALGSEGEGTAAYDMLGDIHDLTDLSKHPIMLKLISQQIPFLQERNVQNKPVNSALLYRQMFDAIGARDNAKHIIKLSRKQKLLARLAFDLWLEGKTQLQFQKLEDWFLDYSDNEPLLKRQTTGNTDVFDKMLTDLCNATLLVRDGDDKYRFTHTSYLEFFRALGIFEFIRRGAKSSDHAKDFHALPELPKLNLETLQFFINWWQVCDEDDKSQFHSGFIELLDNPQNQQAKWLGFYIWRFALKSLGHFDISGFPHSIAPDWSGMQFGEDFIATDIIKSAFAGPLETLELLKRPGTMENPALIPNLTAIDLSEADFSDCYFLDVHFLKLNLTQANFNHCRIYQCQFTDVMAANISANDSANITANVESNNVESNNKLQNSIFNNAILNHTRPPALSYKEPSYQEPYEEPSYEESYQDALQYSMQDSLQYSLQGSFQDSLKERQASELYQTLFNNGHTAGIRAMCVSHNNQYLVTAGHDNTIRIWDIAALLRNYSKDSTDSHKTPKLHNKNQTPKCVHILKGHENAIIALQFSHNSQLLASVGLDKTIRLWDTAALLHTYSKDSTDSHKTPKIHNKNQTPKCVHILKGHENAIIALQFSHNSQLLASAGEDKTIRIWDTAALLRTYSTDYIDSHKTPKIHNKNQTPKSVHILKGHEYAITALQFSHNSQLLASAGEDKAIRIWDTAALLHNYSKGSKDSKDSTDSHKTPKLHNKNQTPKCVHILKGHEYTIMALQFSHNSQLLASAGFDSTIRLWDTAALLRNYSKDSKDSHKTPKLHNKNQTPKCLHILKGHQYTIMALQFSHNSQLLASAGHDNTIRLWDTAALLDIYSKDSTDSHKTPKLHNKNQTPKCLHILNGHENAIMALQFSHNSQLLASAGHDNTIRLWDTAALLHTYSKDSTDSHKTPKIHNKNQTPKCVHILNGHEYPIMALQFSHNSQLLASAGFDKTIRLWDTAALLDIYSKDSKDSTDSYKTPKIHNKNQTPKCVHILKGHENAIIALQFSHNSQLLASAGEDKTIRIWDTAALLHTYSRDYIYSKDSTDSHKTPKIHNKNQTPKCVHILKGHEDPIMALQFSHNSQLLASAGNDKTICLWDTAAMLHIYSKDSTDSHKTPKIHNKNQTPKCVHILNGHEDAIYALQFSHNSQLLASAGRDKTIRLWDTAALLRNYSKDSKDSTDSHKTPKIHNKNQTPKSVHILNGHENAIYALQFSHNSQLLASAGLDKTIRLWDTAALLRTYSKDSKDSHKTPKIHNKNQTPKCVHILNGHENAIYALQFSHNSQLLASAGHDNTIRLWDTAALATHPEKKPTCLQVLKGPEEAIRSLQFSADNQYLLCSSHDEILIWHMQSFECVQSMRQTPDGYIVFATQSNGNTIAYKELLAAQGDAWDYLHTIDEAGNALPAAYSKDWDKIYTP